MPRTRASWRIVFLTYPCPTCGAAPTYDCVTANGKPYTDIHVERTRNANRCPRCGSLIAADDEPGAYCPKCQLLRQLEVERATLHKRRYL